MDRESNLKAFLAGNHPDVPNVVYHGTGNKHEGVFKSPSFFTSDPQGAEWYAKNRGENPQIMPVHLSMKNPLDARSKDGIFKLIEIARRSGVHVDLKDHPNGWTFESNDISNHSPYEGDNPLDLLYIPKVRNALHQIGHDGVIASDVLSNDEIPTFIPLHPHQIKSATGNSGMFDPNNPDITKKDGGEVDREKNLAAWHEGSHIETVGAKGKPRVFYHGTGGDFSVFNPEHRSESVRSIFLSHTPEFANQFATEDYPSKKGKAANIMPVYVSVKDPFDYQDKEHVDNLLEDLGRNKDFMMDHEDDIDEYRNNIKKGNWQYIEDPWVQDSIQKRHDGFFAEGNGHRFLSVYRSNQIKSATGNQGTFDPNDPDITKDKGGEVDGITAYHGSPHKFDKFDLSEINEKSIHGKNFGHGLYFAENEPTAFEYKKPSFALDSDPQGHMYEVHIDAHPDHFLDWDKPLIEQSEYVKNIVGPMMDGQLGITGEKFYKYHFGDQPKYASDYLSKHGIHGIKYVDYKARGKWNPETGNYEDSKHNYVVFDHNRVNIKRRYAYGGEVEGYAKGGDTAIHKGKKFWSGIFDAHDGFIREVHPYKRAEASDFHHSYYVSPQSQDAMKQGDAGFFWVDSDGSINTHWRDDEAPKHIVDAIKSQIEPINKKDGGEVEAYADGGFIPHGDPQRDENLSEFLSNNHPDVPHILYHGAALSPDKDISKFYGIREPKYRYSGLGGFTGIGTFLSSSPEIASSYPFSNALTDTRRVYPVHASIKNPKIYKKISDAVTDMNENYGGDHIKYVKDLMAKGFDGITYKEGPSYHPNKRGMQSPVWVVFRPTQIKSAIGNQGTFDPNDPDITKADGGVIAKHPAKPHNPAIVEHALAKISAPPPALDPTLMVAKRGRPF